MIDHNLTPGALPEQLRGLSSITEPVAPSPALRASGLPARYSPKVAGYVAGPILDPQLVTPSAWRWRNTRTFVIRHSDGLDYRAVRLYDTSRTPEFVGYWAVEQLGTPLTELEKYRG